MNNYIKLLRIHHYIKNALILLPLFFSRNIFNTTLLYQALIGFVCFSLTASAIYIFNDIFDRKEDAKHPKKKMRPIACGKVSVFNASIYAVFLIVFSLFLSFQILPSSTYTSIFVLLIYVILNILYTISLKHKPIIDITLLSSGFLLRLYYGSMITDIEISKWLYLIILSISFYMGLGKRRNEFLQKKEVRPVLQYYTKDFFDKSMTIFFTLIIVFYSLWATDIPQNLMIWTIPIVIIIMLKYSLNIETKTEGDPIRILYSDSILVLLTLLYGVISFTILYYKF